VSNKPSKNQLLSVDLGRLGGKRDPKVVRAERDEAADLLELSEARLAELLADPASDTRRVFEAEAEVERWRHQLARLDQEISEL